MQSSWNLVTYPKIYLGLIFCEMFFQNSNWLLRCQHFLMTSVIFDHISLILNQEGLEKKFVLVFQHISSRHGYYKVISFCMGNLVCSWKYLTSMTVFKYNDVTKKSLSCGYYLGYYFKYLLYRSWRPDVFY